MPQEVLCIITPLPVQPDNEVVHFKHNGLCIIPLDFCGIDEFVTEAGKFGLLSDYFRYVKSKKGFVAAKGFDENDETDAVLIKYLEENEIDTFIIEEYNEWEHVPFESIHEKGYLRIFEFSFIYVKEGEIITCFSSIHDANNEDPGIKYRELQRYRNEMGLDINWNSADQFYSYESAAKEYFK